MGYRADTRPFSSTKKKKKKKKNIYMEKGEVLEFILITTRIAHAHEGKN